MTLTDLALQPLPAGHPCHDCRVRDQALCSVLECKALAEFKGLGSTLRLRTGETLFREGDAAERVFTITKGSLKLCRLLADGRRQIVAFKFPGDFLGISVDDAHKFTADVIEDTQLCSFRRDRFANFLAEHPGLQRQLYQFAAHELGAAQQQFVILGRKTAEQRLASFLLLLADRTARSGTPGTGFLDLPMSRGDIADYLALTKETVSRLFSALRAQRLIRFHTLHRVEILDRPALEKAAEA